MLLGERGRAEKDQLVGLTKKYNTTGFMYTEYPHKSFWSSDFSDQDYRKALKTVFTTQNPPLLLYVHIPFCEQLCWFCTCHMSITKEYEKVKAYLEFLYKEIDLLREFFDQHSVAPNFREIHLGGGSPTFVEEPEFEALIAKLEQIADPDQLDEFSIEIDPRKVDQKRMKYYRQKGINRISFGVQDFDLEVQKAINRVQPAELIENLLTEEVRSSFENGVNFDLICGLPYQTPQTIQATCERAARMSPDRICLNYLHYSPEYAPHQKIMLDGKNGRPTELPDFHERKLIFLRALEVLTKMGYVRTGYDHFAKPTDAVATAMSEGKMKWNALGVTAGRYSDVIGLGVHSYGTVGNCYAQNFYELTDYQAALEKGQFPIYRGHKLTRDDVIRRSVIQTLRNFFSLDFKSVEKNFQINFKEYFKDELVTLGEFVKDSIAEINENSIVITELGHQFANLVARDFDKYYTGNLKARDLGAFSQNDKTISAVSSLMNTKEKPSLKVKANEVSLTHEQIRFYDESGYLIVPGVFDEEVCDYIKEVGESFAQEDHSVLLNVHRTVPLFMEIVKNPVLVSIVKAVQRQKIVGLNDQYLFKNPGTPYAKQSWNPHQDNAYTRATKGAYLQLHIFLDASDKENGGLIYYPGSHREDILPYEYVKSWKEEFDENGISHPGWKILEIPSLYKKVDVVGPKGGICLQNGNLIHGSHPNFSKTRSRHQYSVAYLNEGEKYMEGSTSVRIPIELGPVT